MSRNFSRTGLNYVHTEGDILPSDILQRILNVDSGMPGLKSEDYGLAPSEKLNEAINRSWQRLLSLWRRFSKLIEELPQSDTGTSQTRQYLLLPLFDELGYGRLQAATTEQRKTVDEEGRSFSYAISHTWGASPIHLVGYNISLDHKSSGVTGAAQRSPHALVQEFLNRSDAHLWGFVSNGRTLRILRDNASLSRQAFIEFDLAALFENQSFADFALLWLLCHQSRVEIRPVEEDKAPTPEGCWMECWSHLAQESALLALEKMSDKVHSAIEILGQGFLDNGNLELRDKLCSGVLPLQEYFHQILRLAYRLIFCFVAEDRDILHAEDVTASVRTRYERFFSFRRLRGISNRLPGTSHCDMYEGVKLVMRLFSGAKGSEALGITPMGGRLWSDDAMPDLMQARLSNASLLQAIRVLAWFGDPHRFGVKTRPVDYQHLGARELGSIYESLLECHPVIDGTAFKLHSAAGNERKKTGAYYTPAQLIASLLDTALEPVLDDASRQPNPEAALLSLKVCDPACGSGHFLLAASRRMAERLASIRSGGDEPSPKAVRMALRDIIGRCIYGVDINPMSVELCKVSLWMETMQEGKPLSFLDHHIICGNSLLGTTPQLIRNGIPDSAYEALEGDDKKAVAALKKRNKKEREGESNEMLASVYHYAEAISSIHQLTRQVNFDDMPSDTLADIEAKETAYRNYCQSPEYARRKQLSDLWCSAFVMHRYYDEKRSFFFGITRNTIRQFAKGDELPQGIGEEVRRLAEEYQFLHWDVAFPEVAARGGFDVMLGNPPWEHNEIKEKEFFAVIRPDIANAAGDERKRMINNLASTDPVLFREFSRARRKVAGDNHFFMSSGRYPCCGKGRINLYAVFAENMRNSVNDNGRVGCIVPSGIATDDTTKYFFRSMIDSKSLVSLFDFENRKKIFPAVDSRMKFSLLTTGNGNRPLAEQAEFVFFAHSTDELHDPDRCFSLSSHDIAQINPNTRTCPIFRSRRDAELTKAVYRRVPVLIREAVKDKEGNVLEEEQNPWGVSFRQGLFNMTSDSGLFRTREQLETANGVLTGNRFSISQKVTLETSTGPLVVREGNWLPLYEAKMVHHYNHRWATYDGTDVRDTEKEELRDPDFCVLPRYWVHEEDVRSSLQRSQWDKKWLMGWRDITNNTNERTAVFSVFPLSAVGHKELLCLAKDISMNFVGNICSFMLDYICRQKIGGTSLAYFVFRQLPVLPKELYNTRTSYSQHKKLSDFILSRVLELTYTAWDMQNFAHDLGFDGPPFSWDEERRLKLRAELDALFFHLYLPATQDGSWKRAAGENDADFKALQASFPTPRAAVDYIMETFPIRKNKDIKDYGIYRTKDEIFRVYDAMQDAMKTGRNYQSPLY